MLCDVLEYQMIISRDEYRSLKSRITELEFKNNKLKQDIDGENTELANRAIVKIKSEIKWYLDSMSVPYFLSKNEHDFAKLKEENKKLHDKWDNPWTWLESWIRAYDREHETNNERMIEWIYNAPTRT